MATYYSTEVTAKNADANYKYDSSKSDVNILEFTYATTTDATGEYVELLELPLGSKVIGYALTHEATGMSDCDIGTTAGGAEIATAQDISAAGFTSGFCAPVTVSTTGKVYLSYDGGTVSADKDITGVIFYV